MLWSPKIFDPYFRARPFGDFFLEVNCFFVNLNLSDCPMVALWRILQALPYLYISCSDIPAQSGLEGILLRI